MKRWGLVWIAAALSCIPILLHRGVSPAMLEDSDTKFLLQILRDRQDPLYWFTHDWPLMNHFYRPISTLTFEMDNALYGHNAAGFGLTNALICCLCVFLVAWLMRELTDSIPLTIGSSALFSLWIWDATAFVGPWVYWAAYALGFLGLFRHGFKVRYWLPAVGAIWFFGYELAGMAALRFRMVDWLPGRTASTMAIFCLIAMAAYARYERISAMRDEAVPTALDEPAGTRSSVLQTGVARFPWVWGLIALLAGALALASYEQAVMLPAALLGVAVALRLQRYRVRWGWQIGFWLLLVAYWLARRQFLPDGTSTYQAQQFRDGPGVIMSIVGYLLPCLRTLHLQYRLLDLGWIVFMTADIYQTVWFTFANLSSYLAARRHWVLALAGYALSIIAYLPMAWLNQFEHYHFWPMALRSLFVVALGWTAWELAVIAVSPPSLQAPPRPAPAPGSLPRR